MSSGNLLDGFVEWARVMKASVVGAADVVMQLATAATGSFSEDADDEELAEDVSALGALGVVARPMPPETIDNKEYACEVIVLRTGAGGMRPIAYRDLRFNKALDPAGSGQLPAEGSTALVGYGGGFIQLSLTDQPSSSEPPITTPPTPGSKRRANIATIYAPYKFSWQDDSATKAHSVNIDTTPGNESISVVHGEGTSVLLTSDSAILRSPDGSACLVVENGKITLNASEVVCNGGLIAGDPSTAVPLLAGSASPGSTKFYVSP